ncbi:MAG: DUF3293 domain-containing protein [Gammaproteobacteria bacterium]|jgi:hypothetical protein|nr:DUF3293 domain-containing protein [Gammaproteobacteria bacterium]MBT5202056.1 DUF3293 domain-containing protein [Gammaproteobacteria bacterium]MBT5603052.1 DUF3293 domain-containing protein [Gammaproteobacteria bacterium]MBT6245340.1 DUF3293 domain-containing protein [Gammaproteobacteria bacterium]
MGSTVEQKTLYNESDFIILDDPPIVLKVAERHDGMRLLMQSFAVDTAAFLSAIRPNGADSWEDESVDRQMQLLGLIEAERLNYFIAVIENPASDWTQQSYVVLGLDKQQAAQWAEQFQQKAYLWVPPSCIPELITLD